MHAKYTNSKNNSYQINTQYTVAAILFLMHNK